MPFAAGYFLALGLPVALIPYLAYLSRPQPQDASQREWYPAGRLLAAVSLYGGALPVLVLPLIGGSYEPLRPAMGEFFRQLSTRAPELGLKSLGDQQIEALSAFVVAALPGALAAYWTAIFTLNLYLGGRIARASGRLGRDWPDLPAMSYPPALAAAGRAGDCRLLRAGHGRRGRHQLHRRPAVRLPARRPRPRALHRQRPRRLVDPAGSVYAGLLLFGPYMALLLTMAGLLEPALKLKRRFGAPPPAT